jgi:hypothetical protein
MNCIRYQQRFSLTCCAHFTTFTLLLLTGCALAPTVESLKSQYGYEVERSPVQIDASASVEVKSTMTPALDARLGKAQYFENYRTAVAALIGDDIDKSGLFARIAQRVDGAQPDYRIKITSVEDHPSGYSICVRLQAFDATTGKEISDHTREASAPILLGLTFEKQNPYLQRIMTGLKADLAADLQQDQNIKKRQGLVSPDEVDRLAKASLTDLLVAADKAESTARARNRAIVAAKNQQLPAILREKKTDELTELVVKIEQAILDLNHECEIAKDQAQQFVASGYAENTRPARGGRDDASQTTTSTQLEETRGLALCYRERIELLKPILTALKEEIANRSR